MSQNTIFKRDCKNHKILQLLVGEFPQLLATGLPTVSRVQSESKCLQSPEVMILVSVAQGS